eukprot:2825295-Amphidinium_carterae.1
MVATCPGWMARQVVEQLQQHIREVCPCSPSNKTLQLMIPTGFQRDMLSLQSRRRSETLAWMSPPKGTAFLGDFSCMTLNSAPVASGIAAAE